MGETSVPPPDELQLELNLLETDWHFGAVGSAGWQMAVRQHVPSLLSVYKVPGSQQLASRMLRAGPVTVRTVKLNGEVGSTLAFWGRCWPMARFDVASASSIRQL